MIISHKHKYIFIKTNKTASTAVEIYLSKFCGPQDIITQIRPEDELIRQQLGYRTAQNEGGFYNHMSAQEIKDSIGPRIWNSYYKFCIERNPCERFISFYFWRNQECPREDIDKFLNIKNLTVLKNRGFDLYTIDKKIAVNKILLYEKLNFKNIPKIKTDTRIDKRAYNQILNRAQIDIIKNFFKEEIRICNYQI
jgi:hypothetical protein